ncbi:MAG: DNA (cytosine-5-)-methyltransferase [Christensenella sp.]
MVNLKVGSLFSGIGGIDLGFRQAGYEIAFANEIDKNACITYMHNFKNGNLTEGDIQNIDAAILPDIDILVAGFPCQPFSVCGKQNGFSDNRGNAFFEIMRIADTKHPQIIFLENVANLAEHDNGRTFNRIYNELAKRDYIIRYIVADACNHGIPQHRTRIYIAAFKKIRASQLFTFPKETTAITSIWDYIDRSVKATDTLYLNPIDKDFERMHSFIKDNRQIYRFADFGIQAGKNELAFTLKANMGTYPNRIPIIKDNFGIRKLSPNECLILQGFPTDFTFPNIPANQAYKQAGNTVCVPIIKAIAKNLASLY